jgi:hypothetical protein
MLASAAPVTRCFGRSTNRPFCPPDKPLGASPPAPYQEFALNLSAKRRLCNTVGGRFIDGTPCCCAVSIARSRAATMTNFARWSLVLVLRAIFGGTKSRALVNVFMISPLGLVASRHDQILSLDPGHLMAIKPATAGDPVLGFWSHISEGQHGRRDKYHCGTQFWILPPNRRGKESESTPPPFPTRGAIAVPYLQNLKTLFEVRQKINI